MGVEAICLESGVGKLDELEPILRFLIESDANCIIAHRTEVFEEGEEFPRGFVC